ncbi:MAG: type II toxin-antitoxin system RelE/ParE family toxin [Candidatus Dormibacteria bacterium]
MKDWDRVPQGKRRWRAYRTALGHEPVTEFLRELPPDDRRAVIAGMKLVAEHGKALTTRLRPRLFEVHAIGRDRSFRVVFATQGRRDHVLLGLVAFPKHTQKTPSHVITLAERRLRDWERRGHRVHGRSL